MVQETNSRQVRATEWDDIQSFTRLQTLHRHLRPWSWNVMKGLMYVRHDLQRTMTDGWITGISLSLIHI